VSNNDDEVTSQALHVDSKLFWKGNTDEVDLQPRCNDVKRRRRSDVLW